MTPGNDIFVLRQPNNRVKRNMATKSVKLQPPAGISRKRRTIRAMLRPVSRLAALRSRTRRIVLMYHAIGHSRFAVHPKDFEAQMVYLNANARIVSLDAIVSGEYRQEPGPLTCAITFDDGYAGVYEYAYPILRRHNFASVLYITTTAIDQASDNIAGNIPGFFPGESILNWSQVREMSENGVTIGSHLCHHLDMRTVSEDQTLEELSRSKSIISQKLSTYCNHFAYPSGWFKPNTIDSVKKSGYRSAVTVRYSTVPRNVDCFRIPRMGVGPENSEYFGRMLRGDLDYLLITRKIRRTFGLED